MLNADALLWLEQHSDVGAIVTSLPDAHEVGAAITDWQDWFQYAVRLCMEAASHESCAIFYQTDRKHDCQLISKAQLVLNMAAQARVRLLWHKIVLRRPVGSVDLYRPSFTHMMAFSRDMSAGAATPDVIDAGAMLYRNAMGQNAAQLAIEFATSKIVDCMVVDPFCGRGSVLAVANALGHDSLGVDIDDEQCRHAVSCMVELPEKTLI